METPLPVAAGLLVVLDGALVVLEGALVVVGTMVGTLVLGTLRVGTAGVQVEVLEGRATSWMGRLVGALMGVAVS